VCVCGGGVGFCCVCGGVFWVFWVVVLVGGVVCWFGETIFFHRPLLLCKKREQQTRERYGSNLPPSRFHKSQREGENEKKMVVEIPSVEF